MIGQKLGSFKIESKLGAGAMGIVYRGVNEATGRQAAIKVVPSDLAQRSNSFDRFKREAEILQQFRHPNIVRFLAVGRSQGTSYFAMEYLAGKTLDKVLEERGSLPWDEVVNLGIQICDALQYAHQHGVVHRDLKPSNLMVMDNGEIKLTDFGIAKDLDATGLTATGRTVGTAAYMAPEQIRGTPEVSHKTDLYALGVVLYQMLTGEVPFQGPTAVVMMHRHLNDPAPQASSKLLDIPLELDRLVERLMAKEPPDRPWDAAAVGMALTELRDKQARGEPIPMVWPGQGTSAGTRIDGQKRTGKKRKKKKKGNLADLPWVQTGLLVSALIALVGVAGYLLWPPSAKHLFAQAKSMMASKEPADWTMAQKEYLDELDRRFPEHPYKEQTQAWRDQIMLHRVRRRAAVLEKNLGGFSEAKTPNEESYASASKLAREFTKSGEEAKAVAAWNDLAATLSKGKDTAEDRPWWLLANSNAEQLAHTMADRQKLVMQSLARAESLRAEGRIPEAVETWRGVVERYEKYAELAPLIRQARYLALHPLASPAAVAQAAIAEPPATAAPPTPPPGGAAPAEAPGAKEAVAASAEGSPKEPEPPVAKPAGSEPKEPVPAPKASDAPDKKDGAPGKPASPEAAPASPFNPQPK